MDGQVPTYIFNASIKSRIISCESTSDAPAEIMDFESVMPFVVEFWTSILSSRFRFVERLAEEFEDSEWDGGLRIPFGDAMAIVRVYQPFSALMWCCAMVILSRLAILR